MTHEAIAPSRRHLGRAVLALCAALGAFFAALVVAAGPANVKRSTYAWPPHELAGLAAPARGWYGPLPLFSRVPESIDVHLPCGLSPALPRQRDVILATTRRSQGQGGLRITRRPHRIDIRVGKSTGATFPWPRACPLDVVLRNGQLRLPGRVLPLHLGTPGEMPIVTGLFTNLDLRSGLAPHVEVQTRVYRRSWRTGQEAAAALAVLLALVAGGLLLRALGLPSRVRSVAAYLARARTSLGLVDVVVVWALLLWWVIAPVFFDDGWIATQQRAVGDLGGVGFYFNNWGVLLPLGQGFEWLRHWVPASTNELVLLRIPSLLALLVAWLLCRWCLQRVTPTVPSALARWVLAAAFLVGAAAWGMTLRDEPFMGLLALVCLSAMVSFARRPGALPLIVGTLAAVVGVTAHPVGLVVLAPLAAATPEVIGWLRAERRGWLVLTALALAAFAVVLVLFTLGSDLATRLGDAHLVSHGEFHNEPFWREYVRYTQFDRYGGDTALRHLSLGLLGFAVAAWLLRRRRAVTGVLALPARSLALGLLLLAFVPSKWPWHFGGLLGIGAVAVAAELVRLRREPEGPGKDVRAILALISVVVVAFWAWGARGTWGELDLQVESWSAAFSPYILVAGLPLVALAPLLIGRTRRKRGKRATMDPLVLTTGGAIAILSFAAFALTAAVLVVDAARAPWTPAHQNLQALAGEDRCGLLHHVKGQTQLVDRIADPRVPTLVAPPISLFFPCAHQPSVRGGLLQIPRRLILGSDRWPITARDSAFADVPDLYAVRAVGHGPSGIDVLEVQERVTGYALLPATRIAPQ